MNASSRWREIEQVVVTALDLPAEERDRYIETACGADSAILSEVRALILAHEQAGDFLDPVTYRALDYSSRAEKTLSAVLQAHPENDKAMINLANAYFGQAVAISRLDRGLSPYWQKTIVTYKALLARGTREPNVEKNYSRVLTFYGDRLGGEGRLPEALEVFQQARAINEKRLAAKPDDPAAATDLHATYGASGEVLSSLGRQEDALAFFRKGLSILESLSAASPQDVFLRDSLAKMHFTVGKQLLRMNRPNDAVASTREAIRICEELASRKPPAAFSRLILAQSWLNVGRIEQMNGRRPAACAAFRQSEAVYEERKKEAPINKAGQAIGAEIAKATSSCAQ